jgi:hypothetical protein
MLILLEFLCNKVVHDIMKSVITNSLEVLDSLDTFLNELLHSVVIVEDVLLQLNLKARKFKQNLFVMICLQLCKS